jgi:acyl-CoA reductase-like NAD-dependent aldehyde dehydrogenase
MNINENEIKSIVESVINRLSNDLNTSIDKDKDLESIKRVVESSQDGLFGDINKAIDAAEVAHVQLLTLGLEKRKEIIQSIRNLLLENAENIAKVAIEETTYGRLKDKILKNKLACLKTPGVEDLESSSYTDDYGLTLVERAPFGVIGSIIPSTNPTSSVINNAISMIAGGNSVVFNPHPQAKESSCLTIKLINRAVVLAGGPKNLVSSVSNPTVDSAKILMAHPKIKLLVVTGGPQVVKTAMSYQKKVIAAGPGNPPCVVDETADIPKAAIDIVSGSGFDNNVVCICEKEILAVSSIVDQLKVEMVKNDAFELVGEQINKITDLIIDKPGREGEEGIPNKKYVGKNAQDIAREISLDIPERTKILLCEVQKNHPLVWTEQLMPVIPLVRFDNVDQAIDFAVSCEHGFRHTASMHSKNIDKLSKMAKLMNCSLFVKNGPCYCGLGYKGAGYTSFTIATPTGEGLTKAKNFTRERRCTLVGSFRIV